MDTPPLFGALPNLPDPNVNSESSKEHKLDLKQAENDLGNYSATNLNEWDLDTFKSRKKASPEEQIEDEQKKSSTTSFEKKLAEAMGVLISAGSLLSKAPQVLQVFRSRSVQGLSLSMFAMEIATQSIAVAYHYDQGFPLSAYGENISLGIGNLAIVLAFWLFGDSSLSKLQLGAGRLLKSNSIMSSLIKTILPSQLLRRYSVSWRILATVVLLIPAASISLLNLPKVLNVLQAARTPLYCISRVPQIWALYSTKMVGELSSVSFAVNLLGSVMRLFTSKHQAGNDPSLLAGFWSSIVLNALILAQIAMYTKRN